MHVAHPLNSSQLKKVTLGLYLALYHPKFSSCICCGSAITMVSMVSPIGSLNVAHAFYGISMVSYFMLFPIADLDDFDRFVRYIWGDRVNLLEVPSPWSPQNTTIKPPWNIVLAFEHKLRREAMKKVNHDGETLAAALEAATKDSDLKESYFTTALALQAGEAPPWSKWQRLEYKGRGKEHKGDWKGDGKAGWKGHTKNKDGKPTHKGKYGKLGHLDLVSHTPDGREICYV